MPQGAVKPLATVSMVGVGGLPAHVPFADADCGRIAAPMTANAVTAMSARTFRCAPSILRTMVASGTETTLVPVRWRFTARSERHTDNHPFGRSLHPTAPRSRAVSTRSDD
jgi:hypothetical protein